MTPNQQAQKDRARAEAEEHLDYSAVDRKRDRQLREYEARDARINGEDRRTAMKVRDTNNAYAGDD